MIFIYRFILYFILFASTLLLRNYLDRDGVFISSDGEIKLYQSYGHSTSGYSNFECFYPAKEIDPEFKHFIFDYPFAFFDKFQKSKCVFQYPPLFSMLGSFSLNFFPLKFILYIPLLFYFFLILTFDRILSFLKINATLIVFSTLISFTVSIFPLSIFDFSEMSFYNLFLLLCILCLGKSLSFSELKKVKLGFFILGILLMFTFFIRSEIALFAVLVASLLLVYFYRMVLIWNMIFFSLIGALIPLAIFITFNIWSVEFPLGMRTFTVLTDTTAASRTGFDYHFKIAKAFLWGDEEMTGLIKAFPIFLTAFFFLIPKFFKKFPLLIKILLLSSLLYIFIGAFTTPTRGGVQNFGLRYMETGILPLLIAVIFGINEFIIGMSNSKRVFLFLFLFLLLIPGFKFVQKGIKTLTTNSTYYYQMQNFFSEVGESYIIHDSLNSPYLVGTSFLKQKHIYVGTDEEMKLFEQKFVKQKVETFMIITHVGTPYISINIPDFLYPKMFSKLQYDPKYYIKYKEENLFNFNMKFYKKK